MTLLSLILLVQAISYYNAAVDEKRTFIMKYARGMLIDLNAHISNAFPFSNDASYKNVLQDVFRF